MATGVVGLPPLGQLRLSSQGLQHRAQRRAMLRVSCVGRDVGEAPEELPTFAAPLERSDALAIASAETLTLSPSTLEPNPFSRLWERYLALLEEKPIFVKSMTSLFGFLIGDICAQLIGGGDYDLYRTVRMTLFGILMDGPIGHCWYLFLDKNVLPETPRTPKAIVAKTALDQLLWAPFFSCVFFTFNQTLQGHPELALTTIQSTLIPTLTANYALWPLAHLINFKFVPSNQRILYINFVQILWTSYLSNLAARHVHHIGKVHKHIAHPSPLFQNLLHHGHHLHSQTDLFHSTVQKILGLLGA